MDDSDKILRGLKQIVEDNEERSEKRNLDELDHQTTHDRQERHK